MATSHKRTQRGADLSGGPPISSNAFNGADALVVPNTVINDDFSRSRADQLDAEAAYYGQRARQEEQALGPGYYVELLRGMATRRAAMAKWLRTSNGAR